MPILGDEAYVLSKKYIDKQIIEAGGHTHDNKTIVDKLNADDSILTYDGVIVGSSLKSTSASESAILGAELLDATGWTTDGWTGDFVTGFTHTTGNTSALRRSVVVSAGKKYLLTFSATPPQDSTTNITVALGGAEPTEIYKGSVTLYNFGIVAVDDGDLIITPYSTYTGIINNVSLKEVISTIDPCVVVSDSGGDNALEVRCNLSTNLNLFIGTDSGKNHVTSDHNVALGVKSLENTTSGFWNAAFGYMALNKNTVGSRNVAIGNVALQSNISGHRNIAVGNYALSYNTFGNDNIAIGADALFVNTTGLSNIGIGLSALSYNTTGNYNIGVGRNSLNANTSGVGNIGIGQLALGLNQIGNNNIAIGTDAVRKTNDSNNVGIGQASLYNTIGKSNTAVGDNAGHGSVGSVSYSYNTLIGCQSGANLAAGADTNTLIGYQAGDNITTGARNIIIGSVNADSATGNDQLNIGGLIKGNMAVGSKNVELLGGLKLSAIPTVDPHVAGQVWNNSNVLTVSAG